ncbi:MAG: glutaredoxin family protein [Hydrogenophaga sp.]|nr:glutaredoxin family protein [Hydrogenophaga sp.]
MKSTSIRDALATGLSLAVLFGSLVPLQASAQGVYRIVGPDGKVSYSDQPPENTPKGPVIGGPSTSAAAAANYMPAELRQAMGRYPVTLYAGKDCTPCDNGRRYLNTRGIPYTEKTVNTNDDVAALKRLSGATNLPLLTVGGQHIKGYSEPEWAQYLDAAGYPKTSMLSSTYRRAAPTPLVEVKPASNPAADAKKPAKGPEAAAPAEVPVTPPVTNPSGIRF